MKTIYKQIAIVIIGLVLSQQSFAQGPTETVDTNIVGEWVSIEDNSVRLEFSTTGTYILFYANEMIDECDYEVSGEDCTGSNSPIEITYLKLTYSDGEEECNQVSVRNEHMTIIEYPSATISEYTRQ